MKVDCIINEQFEKHTGYHRKGSQTLKFSNCETETDRLVKQVVCWRNRAGISYTPIEK